MDYVSKKGMTYEEVMQLQYEYNNRKKTNAITYVLLILFGNYFLHRFYLGITPYAIFGAIYTLLLNGVIIYFIRDAYINQMIFDYILFLLMHPHFIILPFIPYLWLLLDLFRVPQLVDYANHQSELALVRAIKRSRGTGEH
ncbi:hypothetical protein [Sporosarcina ureae]|uniref:hypothetical protein n=1 Tax=Sporosarcina ureae TaxID=1571 RepID=UPI0009DC7705|nr:hypothetical protein [Sporosarcina ureae]ARF17850.1 hypothetical protein SporoP17a_11555 [Sporosarcina ureae]